MKKRNPLRPVLTFGLLAVGILAITSCGRDAIFFTIATEVPPQPPLIRGGPTQMVVFNWPLPQDLASTREALGEAPEENLEANGSDEPNGPGQDNGTEPDNGEPPRYRPVLFSASGGLFWYTSTPTLDDEGNVTLGRNAGWRKPIGIPDRPRGMIIDIAATQSHLYILVMTGTGVDTSIHRLASGGNRWDPVAFTGPGNIQSIFADPQGGRLFAGVQDRGGHSIWYHEGSDQLRQLDGTRALPNDQTTDNTGLLSGVVNRGETYFISTRNGILQVDGASVTWLTQDISRVFMGIIRLPDGSIITVARSGGFLYRVDSNSLERVPDTSDSNDEHMRTRRDATGAIAIWEDIEGGERMLIAGVQGARTATTFNNGYVEFALNPDGSLNTGVQRRETSALLSVRGQNDQYRTSLGRLPINHLFQAPREVDEDMTFFASTQTAGLWSFRVHNGVPQWNAEN